MKNSVLIIAVAALVFIGCKSGEKHEKVFDTPIETVSSKADGHNSQNSLDWAGVYEATTPCSDCDGIKTVVELKTDKTFKMSQSYLGKPGGENQFQETGDFSWDDNGGSIILETSKLVIRFQVGENHLTLMDMSGNVTSGELGNFYVLKKK